MSAPILHLAILQKLVFLVNSRLGLVSVAILLWLPFSRSYGDILPSSLTKVLPRVLVFSTSYLCRFWYGRFGLDSDFSWQPGIGNFSTYVFDTYRLLEFVKSGFAYFSSYGFRPSFPSDGFAYPFASSLLS